MSDIPEPLQRDLNTFVAKITTDEEQDEKARLKKHLDIIELKIKEAFDSIKVEAMSPGGYRTPLPKKNRPLRAVPMPWFLLLGAWALATTIALSFILGSSYPGLVDTSPAPNPIESQNPK